MSTLKERLRSNLRKFREEELEKQEEAKKKLDLEIEKIRSNIIQAMYIASGSGKSQVYIYFKGGDSISAQGIFYVGNVYIRDCVYVISRLKEYFENKEDMVCDITDREGIKRDGYLRIDFKDNEQDNDTPDDTTEN